MAEGPIHPMEPLEEKWTVLMRVRRPESAQIIAGLLDSDLIECELIDKTLSEMPVPVLGTVSYVEIWVPQSREAEARRAIDLAREGNDPCQKCGHLSSPGEPVCEYCGVTL